MTHSIHLNFKRFGYIGKLFKQYRLAFHDGLAGQRADVAEPQNSRAVADHGNQIGAGGIAGRIRRIFYDFIAGFGHAPGP